MNVKDLVVHASTQPEPFGLVIIDAMPAGKPVIASNGGAAPEILRDRENGLIVEPADAGQHFSIERYLHHMTRALPDIAAPAPESRWRCEPGEASLTEMLKQRPKQT